MGANLGSGGGPISDINVTPLIDVVLVLLVVFMVVTPMLESGMPVDLPKVTANEDDIVSDAGQFVVVSVAKDKESGEPVWYVEQDEVDETTLVSMINAEYARRDKASSILIKGDRTLEYQKVREVMNILADNNMTNLLVATNQED